MLRPSASEYFCARPRQIDNKLSTREVEKNHKGNGRYKFGSPSLEASFGKAVFYRFFVGVGAYFAAKRIGDVFSANKHTKHKLVF